MAYTYDDFISAAKGANMLDRFSQQDLVTAQKNPEFGLSMLSLQKDLDSAATEEQRLLASEAANQLRKTYGSYTQDATGNPSFAGSYGAQIDKTMDQLNNYGSFNFSGQEAYKKLQEQIANQQPFQYGSEDAYQKLLQNVSNPQPFTYDPETDPQMAAYKKMYLREGDRATASTLAKASTGTGGVPSSFAVTAAQQAGNYYAGQLADIIPTLYQQSYEQYLNDQNLKQGALGALRSDRDYENQQYLNQYNMLMNLLGNMQTERDYENQQYLNRYNMLQNQLGNLQTQQNTQYNQFLDALNHAYRVQQDQLGQDLQQQQLAEAAKQQEFNNALALYQVLGYMTPEMEKILLGTTPAVQEQTPVVDSGWYGDPDEPEEESKTDPIPFPDKNDPNRYDPTNRTPVISDNTPTWLKPETALYSDTQTAYQYLKGMGVSQEKLKAWLEEEVKEGKISSKDAEALLK